MNEQRAARDGTRGFGLLLCDQILFGNGRSMGELIREHYKGVREPVLSPRPISIEEFERDMESMSSKG